MPNVNGKKFPYTAAGMSAAKKAAKKMDSKSSMMKKKPVKRMSRGK
jgi:hypothetical protein